MGVVTVVLVARRKKKIFEVCLVGRHDWSRNEVQTNVSDRILTGEIKKIRKLTVMQNMRSKFDQAGSV